MRPEGGHIGPQQREPRPPAGAAGTGCWRAFPDPEPAELGVARLSGLADELVSTASAPVRLAWRSQRALLVTWRDRQLSTFREASARTSAMGWPVTLRKGGGSACPVGPGTVQVATIAPVVAGMTMNAEYEALTECIQTTLRAFRAVARSGSVAGGYCPGRFDLSIAGKKIAGMSQRWFRNRHGIECVVTAASVNVAEPPDVLARVVNGFYADAGSPMRCQAGALTSVGLALGTMGISAAVLTLAFSDYPVVAGIPNAPSPVHDT